MEQTDILIIGGGLAGCALADALAQAGRDFILVEAQDRLGGRIKTMRVGADHFDLGPAWFWDGQPRMATAVARFGVQVFDQYAEGELSFEDERGAVHRGQGYASMAGSHRLDGGMRALVEAFSRGLPKGAVRLGQAVSQVRRATDGIEATFVGGAKITAKHVVLALPPRVAAMLAFDPVLPADAMQAMMAVPTWMAGQAKAVAVYDRPFWREGGLSGDAMSRYGPMVEIHDASPVSGATGALFGFIGVPPKARQDQDVLRKQVIAQLGRLFGENATMPTKLEIKDWACDPRTAVEADQAPLYAHPRYGMPVALADLWGGRLVFGGTEVARDFGGYLEGALEAAEQAFRLVDQAKEQVP